MIDTLSEWTERTLAIINKHIMEKDFRPRDADGSDFQYGTDPGLRFKTGTVRGEVTVSVWRYERRIQDPIRIFTDKQAVEAKHEIDRLAEEFFMKRRVS